MKEKLAQKNAIRLLSFRIINIIFKEQTLKRNTEFLYAPFLKTGEKKIQHNSYLLAEIPTASTKVIALCTKWSQKLSI